MLFWGFTMTDEKEIEIFGLGFKELAGYWQSRQKKLAEETWEFSLRRKMNGELGHVLDVLEEESSRSSGLDQTGICYLAGNLYGGHEEEPRRVIDATTRACGIQILTSPDFRVIIDLDPSQYF